MKCKNCGGDIPDDAKHCPNCGAARCVPSLQTAAQQPVQMSQTQSSLSWWEKIWNQPRLSRKDFWILYFPILIFQIVTGATVIIPIFLIVLSFVITAHRLHDTNRSAWNLLWLLLPVIGRIILIVFETFAGTKGPNKYGDEPQRIF